MGRPLCRLSRTLYPPEEGAGCTACSLLFAHGRRLRAIAASTPAKGSGGQGRGSGGQGISGAVVQGSYLRCAMRTGHAPLKGWRPCLSTSILRPGKSQAGLTPQKARGMGIVLCAGQYLHRAMGEGDERGGV